MLDGFASFSGFVSADEAEVETFHTPSGQYRRVTRYFTRDPGPYGYLVGMPADDIINPHFHRVDQFQVFYGTPGARYKDLEFGPGRILVHYADAYSTYGPVTSGPVELEYLTLRAILDKGVGYVPKDRDLLIRTPRHRNIHSELLLRDPSATPGVEVVIPHQHDGVGAVRFRVEPGPTQLPSTGVHSGQYCVVLGGTIRYAGQEYGVGALAWIGARTAPLDVTAGEDGADLLILQFPHPTAPGGDPELKH